MCRLALKLCSLLFAVACTQDVRMQVEAEDAEFEDVTQDVRSDAGPDVDVLTDVGPELDDWTNASWNCFSIPAFGTAPLREDLIGPAYELWTHDTLAERDVTHGRFIEASVSPGLPSILSRLLITQDGSEERVSFRLNMAIPNQRRVMHVYALRDLQAIPIRLLRRMKDGSTVVYEGESVSLEPGNDALMTEIWDLEFPWPATNGVYSYQIAINSVLPEDFRLADFTQVEFFHYHHSMEHKAPCVIPPMDERLTGSERKAHGSRASIWPLVGDWSPYAEPITVTAGEPLRFAVVVDHHQFPRVSGHYRVASSDPTIKGEYWTLGAPAEPLPNPYFAAVEDVRVIDKRSLEITFHSPGRHWVALNAWRDPLFPAIHLDGTFNEGYRSWTSSGSNLVIVDVVP